MYHNVHIFDKVLTSEEIMLCPICGMESKSTSVICPKHTSITYDKDGKVISWNDYDFITYLPDGNVIGFSKK